MAFLGRRMEGGVLVFLLEGNVVVLGGDESGRGGGMSAAVEEDEVEEMLETEDMDLVEAVPSSPF